MPQDPSKSTSAKTAAKQCFMAADRFLKDFRFDEARREIEKAKQLDPTNMYVHAFLDRINYFEQQRKKEASSGEPPPKKASPPPPAPKTTPPPSPPAPQQSASPPAYVPPAPPPSQPVPQQSAPHPPYVPPAAPVSPQYVPPPSAPQYVPPPPQVPQYVPPPSAPQYAPPPPQVPQYVPPPSAPQYAPSPQQVPQYVPQQSAPQYVPQPQYAPPPQVQYAPPPMQQPQHPQQDQYDPYAPQQRYAAPVPSQPTLTYVPPAPELRRPPSNGSQQYEPTEAAAPPAPPQAYMPEQQRAPEPASGATESQLEQMKRQIELLTQALEQEKVAREEIKKQQIQGAVTQFRQALEKAWSNGAPPETEVNELHKLAVNLQISDVVEQTVTREVKLDTYSKAVKEVIAKRQLLRSSSSTLEWLRKVYQVTLEEYLEYESKFLLDLVADQYRGTLYQISHDDAVLANITPKLKSFGYAVVTSKSPEEALEKIEKINPNLILCDTDFGPQALSGIRFLHVIRNNSKFNTLPFILLCHQSEVSQLQSSELRANESYVQKPVNFDELTSVINKKLVQYREYIATLS